MKLLLTLLALFCIVGCSSSHDARLARRQEEDRKNQNKAVNILLGAMSNLSRDVHSATAHDDTDDNILLYNRTVITVSYGRDIERVRNDVTMTYSCICAEFGVDPDVHVLQFVQQNKDRVKLLLQRQKDNLEKDIETNSKELEDVKKKLSLIDAPS